MAPRVAALPQSKTKKELFERLTLNGSDKNDRVLYETMRVPVPISCYEYMQNHIPETRSRRSSKDKNGVGFACYLVQT